MAMNGKGTLLDASTLPVKEFDGIIVGGGGSGMMASLQLAKSGMNTAVVSKVFPTRSHTRFCSRRHHLFNSKCRSR